MFFIFVGIWADEDSDNEDAQTSSRRGRAGASGKKQSKDYTAPIGFVAGGIQQSGKKKDKEQEAKDGSNEGCFFFSILHIVFLKPLNNYFFLCMCRGRKSRRR